MVAASTHFLGQIVEYFLLLDQEFAFPPLLQHRD